MGRETGRPLSPYFPTRARQPGAVASAQQKARRVAGALSSAGSSLLLFILLSGVSAKISGSDDPDLAHHGIERRRGSRGAFQKPLQDARAGQAEGRSRQWPALRPYLRGRKKSPWARLCVGHNPDPRTTFPGAKEKGGRSRLEVVVVIPRRNARSMRRSNLEGCHQTATTQESSSWNTPS